MMALIPLSQCAATPDLTLKKDKQLKDEDGLGIWVENFHWKWKIWSKRRQWGGKLGHHLQPFCQRKGSYLFKLLGDWFLNSGRGKGGENVNLLGDHFKLFLQISVSLLKLVELGLQQPSASLSPPCHCHDNHQEPWNSSIWTPAQVWLGPRESLLFASGSTPAPKVQDIMQNQISPSPPSNS